MPKRSDRSKKKKFRRTASGKSKLYFAKDKPGKHHCAECKAELQGVPHGKTPNQVKKLSKSQRRPSALFAGTLCNKCRTLVVEEAAKISNGTKKLDQVELRLQKYVKTLKVN